jgi:hypothetical protein
MGIILTIFSAIVYAIAIAAYFFINARFAPKIDSSLERKRDHNAGFAIAIVITLAFAWLVPSHGNNDFEAVVIKIATTLSLPLLLGSLLLAISHSVIGTFAYRLGRIASGVLDSVLWMPFAGMALLFSSGFILAGYNRVANFPMYFKLCSGAEVRILEKVESAKSLSLMPDSFVQTNQIHENGVRRTVSTGEMLMYHFPLLDFVERTSSTRETGPTGKLERITPTGDRLHNIDDRSGKTMKLSFNPIDRFTAEYQIRPSTLPVPEGEERGIGGERIEVVRASDGKLIAFAQYYWDDKGFRSCPNETTKGHYFVQWFIADALNLTNVSGLASVLPR